MTGNTIIQKDDGKVWGSDQEAIMIQIKSETDTRFLVGDDAMRLEKAEYECKTG